MYGRYGYLPDHAALNRKRVERIWRRPELANGERSLAGLEERCEFLGSRCRRSSPSAAGCGCTTAPASGCGRTMRTTSLGGLLTDVLVEESDHPCPQQAVAIHPTQLCRGQAGPRRYGRRYRLLNVVDEFTRECLAIRVNPKLGSTDVIDVLSDLFILRGVPGHVRSDNGPGVRRQDRPRMDRCGGGEGGLHRARQSLGDLLIAVPAGTDRQLCCRWENGYCESFNSKLRDELLRL